MEWVLISAALYAASAWCFYSYGRDRGLAAGLREAREALVPDIRRIQLQDNDRLVIRTDKPITMEQAERMRREFEGFVGDGKKIAIVPPGFHVEVVGDTA